MLWGAFSFGILSLFICSNDAFSSTNDTLPSQLELEQLYTAGAFETGLERSRLLLRSAPEDIDLYWHTARFYYEVGEQYDKYNGKLDKKVHYTQMLEVVEDGLARSPDHPHLLFARGIALGRLGTTKGILASLRWADDIEEAWLKSRDSQYSYRSLGGEEILPCDVTMGLGSFYRMVPEWWIIKVLSGTRGDLDKALTYLHEADTCSPERIEIRKELGVAYICHGQSRKLPKNIERGKDILRETLSLAPAKPTDHIDLRHVQRILDEPSMACEYSRDGQADLDREKLSNQGY